MKLAQIQSFYWSIFSCIWTGYGDVQSKSLFSVRMWENMDQKKNQYLDMFHAVIISGFQSNEASHILEILRTLKEKLKIFFKQLKKLYHRFLST